MCHVSFSLAHLRILPKKILKTLEKACQNYYNYNLIIDVFQPSILGKNSLHSQERRTGTNQLFHNISGILHKSWFSLGSLGPFQPAERQVSMDC